MIKLADLNNMPHSLRAGKKESSEDKYKRWSGGYSGEEKLIDKITNIKKSPITHTLIEGTGPALAAMPIGAGVGALALPKNRSLGAMIGAGLGAGAMYGWNYNNRRLRNLALDSETDFHLKRLGYVPGTQKEEA